MWSNAKIASIFIVFFVEFFFGILGCVIVKCLSSRLGVSSKFRRVLSMLNCFTGGVFFSTSILHLLPEAREEVSVAIDKLGIVTEFPVTETLTGLGFLLILFIETTAKACCGGGLHYGLHEVHSNTVCPDEENNSTKSKPEESKHSRYGSFSNVRQENHGDASTVGNGTPKAKDIPFELAHADIKNNVKQTNLGSGTGMETNNRSAVLRGAFLLIALSIHMIFDGLALGLLPSDDMVWTLLVALSIHKILVFLTIGIQLSENVKSGIWKIGITILVMAIVSPIGIIMGVAIATEDAGVAGAVAIGTLQSIATGTFLYVTFFEILQKEFCECHGGVVMATATVIGFLVVACIRLMEHGEENVMPSNITTTTSPITYTPM